MSGWFPSWPSPSLPPNDRSPLFPASPLVWAPMLGLWKPANLSPCLNPRILLRRRRTPRPCPSPYQRCSHSVASSLTHVRATPSIWEAHRSLSCLRSLGCRSSLAVAFSRKTFSCAHPHLPLPKLRQVTAQASFTALVTLHPKAGSPHLEARAWAHLRRYSELWAWSLHLGSPSQHLANDLMNE